MVLHEDESILTGVSIELNGVIIPVSQTDIAVSKILIPTGNIPQDTTIVPGAIITNLGLNQETFPVRFEIGTEYTESLNLILESNQSDTITFPAWSASKAGSIPVICRASCPGDEYPANDYKTLDILVIEPPDFSLSAEPDKQTIHPGESADFTIRIRGNNSFSAPVMLDITPSISGTNFRFLPNPVTDTTSVLTIQTDSTLTPNQYKFLVSGSDGDSTRQANILLNVVPDTTIDVAVLEILAPRNHIIQGIEITPQTIIRNMGTNESSFLATFTIGSTYSETLNLTFASKQSKTISFPVWYAADVGHFQVQCVTACLNDEDPTNDSLTDTILVDVAPDFSLSAEPVIRTHKSGETALYTIKIIPTGEFSSPVSLSLSPIIPGIVPDFSPNQIEPKTAAVLSIGISNSVSPAQYDFLVTGSDGIENRVVSIQLKIEAGQLIIQPNPFTPNNDSYNDQVHFNFLGMGFQQPELKIFNMNGKNIRSFDQPVNYEFKWDGR